MSKNRLRKLKSLLLSCVMIFTTIMPIMGAEPVSAASTSEYAKQIYIGKNDAGSGSYTAIIKDGQSYTPKGADKPTATYKDGVLTLDNYNGESIEAYGSFTINLIGTNTINLDMQSNGQKRYGINANTGLAIVGTGTLNINLDNSNNVKADVTCVNTFGELLVKSDININTKHTDNYTVWGLYGERGVEISGAKVTITDSSTSARYIYGIYSADNIYIKNVNFTLKSSNDCVNGIYGSGIINIENSTIIHQGGESGFGIYTNDLDGGAIGIKNSVLDISGCMTGIADYSFHDEYEVAGVSIEDSDIKIENCYYGIDSCKRGMKIEDSDVTITAKHTCITDFYNSPSHNYSNYGVKILGRSVVNLVSTDGYAIKLLQSTFNIAITQEGKLTAKAATQMPIQVAAKGHNMDLYTQLVKGEMIGTAPWGEQNADGSYSLEFVYSEPIIVTWDKDTNKVAWKASGGVIGMEGFVGYHASLYAKDPSIANGEYGSTAIWSDSTDGPQADEVTIPSGMIVDTMDYKVVVTPRINGATSSVSGEAERIHTADIESMNIRWDNLDWYTAKWQASAQEDEEVHMLLIIKKYDESSKTYVQVTEKEFRTPADGSYDLRALSSADGTGDLPEGEYKAEVRLFKGSKENILAKGETADTRQVKYLKLSDSGSSDIADKTDVKILRNSINGERTMEITDKNHLLRGDEVTLSVKNLAEGEQLSGWHIKTKKTNSNVSYIVNGKEATFKMLVDDVVAYPLFGSNPLEKVDLVYSRTDAKTDNYIKRLGRVKSKLKYDESKLASIDISWQDEDGNVVLNMDALQKDMDVTKNYIGSVVLTAASGYFFTNDTVVTLADKSSDSSPVTSRALEIKYGTVRDGKYYFDLYFANVPEVTIDGTAVREAETKVPNYYKFEYDTCNIALDTGIGTLKGARVTAKIGDILFGDSAKIKINGTSYDGGLSWYTASDSENSVKVYSQNDITLYPIPDTPLLEYPDGTTFHADSVSGTTIKLQLDEDYRDALAMPDPQMSYQVNGGEIIKTSVWSVIEFELKGGDSAEIKVWVENSAEATYTYHGVDIFSEGAYTPILTPSGKDFTDEVAVTIANKLPNVEYVYTTDPNDADKTDASQWTSPQRYKSYEGGIKLTDSATVCVAAREFDSTAKVYTYTTDIAKETYTRIRPGSTRWITVNGNVDLTSSLPYFVNGKASATGTLGESGCTAYFHDGKLQLNGYNGGSISTIGGSFTIELIGTNIVTGGGIENKYGSTADGYIVIEGDGNLTVNNIASADNTANTQGIYSYAGKVTLCGNVNVNVKVDSGLGFASGIYAHGIEILDNASYMADVVSHVSTGSIYGVGIYVSSVGSEKADVLINTTGDVVIDNSSSAQSSITIYNLTSGEIELRNVGLMTLLHKSTRDMHPDLTYDANKFYRSEEKDGDTVTAVYRKGEAPMSPTPVGAGVSGTVTSYGNAEADVTIHLTEQGGTEPAYEKIVKGNTAAYSFENVSAGTYVMKVMKDNHVAREYTITVGSSDIVQNAAICLLGDVNGDGKVNAKDRALLTRHINETSPLSGYQFDCGNVVADNKINAKDRAKITMHINESVLLW